jgi:AraC family transcriptional regulator
MRRPSAPVQYLFPNQAQFHSDNLVLHARAREHVVTNFAGPNSIKAVMRGEVAWSVRGRALLVDENSFLFLPSGEPYSMNIQAARPVETCCAFFRIGYMEEVLSDMTSSLASALQDSPVRKGGDSVPVLPSLHFDPQGAILRRLRTLAERCAPAVQPSSFEQDFLYLACHLSSFYEDVREKMARLPAVKAATRQELFQRLERGREFLHSHSSGPVSLEEAARSAALSPYHFHRAFRQAHRVTPHAYVTGLRLARARDLLRRGTSVLETCLECGFQSPTSFSRLFRAHFGMLPSRVVPLTFTA